MKVLISAYACSPFKGSETGVGWACARKMSDHHDVFIITHSNNKNDWDKASSLDMIPRNISVKFIGKARCSSTNAVINRIQDWIWYVQFNKHVYNAALEWHKESCFDLCHHVTIATWRIPSQLWRMPIPFIWGPIGGAGRIPKAFRRLLSLKGRIFEIVRDLQSWAAFRSSDFKSCIDKSTLVIAANQETYEMLSGARGDRPMMILPVWAIPQSSIDAFKRTSHHDQDILRLFAGGSIEGRKGFHLALLALKRLSDSDIKFHYTIAGIGPESSSIKKIANFLGISQHITFHPGYTGESYIKTLMASDVFLLPSFRETLGMTLIEATLAGCYPVVADISAQAEIVKKVGGAAIPVHDINQFVNELFETLRWCANNLHILKSEHDMRVAELIKHYGSDTYEAGLLSAYKNAVTYHSSKSND